MTGDPVSCDLPSLSVSRREVLRNLGYPRRRTPSPRVAETLDRLWETAQQLMTPRGVLRIVSGGDAARTGMPEVTDLVGIGVCTVGPGLEQQEQRLSQAGQMLEALVLDAFGSAGAEAAADAVNVRLCALAAAGGYQLPPRISPGYGRWDISGQTALLELLDAGSIDIRLTEGLMMVPRKSVSFAVRFVRGLEPGRAHRRRCAGCDLLDCAYRVEEDDDDEH